MPPRLMPLLEAGVIDSVIRPLLSGKEAQVYLVETAGELRAAKVYKSSEERTFRHRSVYTEGRKVRNSRDQRAIDRRSRHGRERDEESWTSAEADTIYKLDAAGVRVPRPYAFMEGVLVMECVESAEGGPAPRLAECTIHPADVDVMFDYLIGEVVKMLCADVVHGDLSIFNILLGYDGPVIIDFPQSVDAARNPNARSILLRDVENLTTFFKPDHPPRDLRYGHEMWALYERGELRPETRLTGRFDQGGGKVDTDRLLQEIWEVHLEEDTVEEDDDYAFSAQARRGPPRPAPGVPTEPTSGRPGRGQAHHGPGQGHHGAGQGGRGQGGRGRGGSPKGERPGPQVVIAGKPSLPPGGLPAAAPPPPAPAPAASTSGSGAEQNTAPKKRRRRRRSRGGGGGGPSGSGESAP